MIYLISTPGIRMSILFAVIKPSTMLMQIACLSIIALTMWLGGFGCAFCCATGLTGSCCLKERNTSADCTERACCKQAIKRNTAKSRDAISRSEGAVGCSLLPDQSRSLAPIPRVANELSDGVQATTSPLELFLKRSFGPIVNHPSPLNRGGTYQRLCVLLI